MDAKLSVSGLVLRLFLSCSTLVSYTQLASAQATDPAGIQFRVQGPSQKMEMIVNSSRILTMDKEIPRAMVNNTELVRVVPLSPNQVQISAAKPGVTTVTLWDEDGQVYSVDVVIFGDARELEMLLQSEFPHAALKVRPLASSVVISGYVDRPDVVGQIVTMAQDYYPKVINNIQVGGVQQVALHTKVMEVSRTKLRAAGFDWANFNGDDFVVQNAGGLIRSFSGSAQSVTSGPDANVVFGVLTDSNAFFGVIEALRRDQLVKVLSEPTLVTVSGRPAAFNSGGEFPIIVSAGLGTISTEFKEFGTRVDFVPIVLGNGNIRLEVRPEISEVDSSRSVTANGVVIPGLRTRWIDTATEMRAGQTMALGGLIQTKLESQNRSVPWLGDIPFLGNAFRHVREDMNEIELLIVVRPELVDPLNPDEVPCVGPGQSTQSPHDVDLYFRGHLEVPNCCPDPSGGNGCHTNAWSKNCGGAACAGGTPAMGTGMPEGTMMGPNGELPSPAPLPNAGAQIGPYGSQPVVSGGTSQAFTALQTARAPATTAYNRYSPSGASIPTTQRSAADRSFVPEMIGPTGYDNLNN